MASCSLLAGRAVAGESEFPEFEWRGLADFRFMDAAVGRSWLERDTGKFRIGGSGDARLLRVDEVLLNLRTRLNWDWSASATAKHAAWQHQPIDLTEAFLLYHPAASSPLRLGGRLGLFFPPVSLENDGVGWTSPYTLNSSAINTWVGEELRTLGAEVQLGWQLAQGDRLGLFAAGFAMNDTTGTLLAWRGFSLHDYEATLNDRLPLPLGIGIDRHFPKQAENTEPFVEVDGNPGFYTGMTLERPGLAKFRALYYDNAARTTAIKAGQYAWHTRFTSLGLRLELPWELRFIGQGLVGNSRMGREQGGRFAVGIDYSAYSLLLTREFGSHRFSVRYDRFNVDEVDYVPADPNRERGSAWTVHYHYTVQQAHQLNLEVSVLESRRAALAGRPANSTETLWQAGYRFFF